MESKTVDNINETGRRIMKVALTLFSEQGYYSTTTKQIAKEAQVNELTLFRHFKSKSNLFQMTMDSHVVEAKVGDILLDLENKSFLESMNLIVKRIYGLYILNTKLYKTQLKLSDNEMEIERLKLSRKINQVMTEYFNKLVSENKIEGNPELITITLLNNLIGILTIDVLTQGNFTDISIETMLEECAKQFNETYIK